MSATYDPPATSTAPDAPSPTSTPSTSTAPTEPDGVPGRPVNAGARFRAGFDALSSIEAALRDGPVPLRTRELVKIRASQINGCAYCLDMHTKDALHEGEDPIRLGLVAAWEEATCFTPEERAALAVTEAVTRIGDHHVPPAVEAEARRHYDDNGYAALLWTVIAINGWNRLAIASHTEPGRYQPGDDKG